MTIEIFDWDTIHEKKEKKSTSENDKRRTTVAIERTDKHIYRRAYSESNLWDALPHNFTNGHSYHCITGGDVDAMSYLQTILRQQSLDYLLLSTWVMAAEDILMLKEWHKSGKLHIIDCYLGEIFPNQYRIEYGMLTDFIPTTGGRVAHFKNHSKIFAGYGNKFHFGIEMSCNINTNPRTENGCITISEEIFQFYKDYFDGIRSYE